MGGIEVIADEEKPLSENYSRKLSSLIIFSIGKTTSNVVKCFY